ncbi:MAG: hydrogenase large subunit [Thermoguttaceae bacterium]
MTVHNGQAFDGRESALSGIGQFHDAVTDAVARGGRISALCARPVGDGCYQMVAVTAFDAEGALQIFSSPVGEEYPSITVDCPQAHWFEREICEQTGIRPLGHPWLKPIRFSPSPPSRGEKDAPGASAAPCGVTDYFSMDGEEVHEVAVGPVHAGIIEPGHFRFQCHGETVYHLEISLGYQHRGIERALIGGPGPRTIHHVETAAGDTSIGHAIAYCRGVESLSETRVPARAQVIRGIALELERIANHIGDLGALAGDVGYLPTMSYCGRIRGDVLNMTAILCGNRFGRGLVRPGGVAFDLDDESVGQLHRRARDVARDAQGAVNMLWDSPSVLARFDRTGSLSPEVCNRVGLVGVAARACGIPRDVRQDFPFGIFRFAQIPVSTWDSGDVFGRAYVRWLEIQRSLAFIEEQLAALPQGPVLACTGPLAPGRMSVAMTEGWRGEICHLLSTDSQGRFDWYKIIDPSFHNWFGLAMSLRNQQISDFPLCNKSFNLSYCGHDL